METFVQTYEGTIRLSLFLGIFAVMAVWEVLAPRRALTVSKAVRWVNNLGLVAFNTILLRTLFPAAAVGMAAFASEQGWGLLNYFALPFWLAVPVAVVAMDFVIWLQHVMVHAIPLLWRMHRVHHAVLDYDLTTGARFHPIEIILSMLLKFATIVVLGPPVLAVVTPDMHRIHHSVEDDEANSNFGFNLSWWDRLFGTYRDQPRGGHDGMTIGIHGYREPREVSWLPGVLALPFRGKISGYAINRRQWSNSTSHRGSTSTRNIARR